MQEIYQWGEIECEFKHTLLLGNGASIALDQRFSYESILQTAEQKGLITPDIQKVFKQFNTHDFELVLRIIWQTHLVNQALKIEEPRTERVYQDIRAALVAAVRDVHVEYDAIEAQLERIYRFMSRFKHVVSLNYDLIVYWAMMRGNDTLGQWFKDGFWKSFVGDDGETYYYFSEDWEWLSEPYGKAKGATLVFYPHGNLMLSARIYDDDVKVARETTDQQLLHRIVRKWQDDDMIPLFVSEGSTQQKLRAIRRSDYLGKVYDSVLPKLGPTLVIYGWSLQDNDDHIMRQIYKRDTANVDKIAVSVHKGTKSSDDVQADCRRITTKIKRLSDDTLVCFFDAQSRGCWIHE